MTDKHEQTTAEIVQEATFLEALALAAKLHAANNILRQKGSKVVLQRLSAMVSLVHVLEHLQAIPGINEQLEPLQLLASALFDVLEGNRSPLFEVVGRPHRPTTGQTHSILKFQTAASVDRLAHSGMKRDDARRYVKAQWKMLGVRQPNGKEISMKLMESWEGWVRAAPARSVLQSAVLKFRQELGRESLSPADAKKLVRHTGKALAQRVTRKDLQAAEYLRDAYPPKYLKKP
jgi:hypothetical protein